MSLWFLKEFRNTFIAYSKECNPTKKKTLITWNKNPTVSLNVIHSYLIRPLM